MDRRPAWTEKLCTSSKVSSKRLLPQANEWSWSDNIWPHAALGRQLPIDRPTNDCMTRSKPRICSGQCWLARRCPPTTNITRVLPSFMLPPWRYRYFQVGVACNDTKQRNVKSAGRNRPESSYPLAISFSCPLKQTDRQIQRQAKAKVCARLVGATEKSWCSFIVVVVITAVLAAALVELLLLWICM